MKQAHSDSPNRIPLFFYFQNDRCQVSIEIGGNYKRGYRKFLSEASLRETLGAAICYSSLSSLSNSSQLTIIDPFCGAGTILQECMSFLENDTPLKQQQRYKIELNPLCPLTAPSFHNPFSHITHYSLLGNDISLKAVDAAKHNFELLSQMKPKGSINITNIPFREFSKQIQSKIESPVVVLTNVEE